MGPSQRTQTRQVVQSHLGPADVQPSRRGTSVQAVLLLLGLGVQQKDQSSNDERRSANQAVKGFKWVDGHMVGVGRSVRAPPGRFQGSVLEWEPTMNGAASILLLF